MLLVATLPLASFSQRLFANSDTLNPKRATLVCSSIGVVGAGSISVLYGLWYSKQTKDAFHLFDDCRNWLQMDKAGHGFTAYHINRYSSELFKWSGMGNNGSIWLGAATSFTYLGLLEIMDGFSKNWGFSVCDLAANTFGSALYTGQELAFKRQYLLPKFSFRPSQYASYRPEVLGNGFFEELLKDYNGQTYWISFSPLSFFKQTRAYSWLCLSVGYGADAKLVGDEEIYEALNLQGSERFVSSREIILSLDLDLTKIPVKREWLRRTFGLLNCVKIPFPAVSFSRTGEKWWSIYY
jgi:hypothetical protein